MVIRSKSGNSQVIFKNPYWKYEIYCIEFTLWALFLLVKLFCWFCFKSTRGHAMRSRRSHLTPWNYRRRLAKVTEIRLSSHLIEQTKVKLKVKLGLLASACRSCAVAVHIFPTVSAAISPLVRVLLTGGKIIPGDNRPHVPLSPWIIYFDFKVLAELLKL